MINSPPCTGRILFLSRVFFFLPHDRSGNYWPTAACTRRESDVDADVFAVVFAHL